MEEVIAKCAIFLEDFLIDYYMEISKNNFAMGYKKKQR